MKYKLLRQLNLPGDLKKLTLKQEEELCRELRGKIIETVAKNGGHLSSNLGAVELTVAIHKVFDSPKDKIVFDVGHQAYAHKLLTGRFDRFPTLRKKGGISGFTRPSESEHDAYVSGHSSNSISVALGMAEAMRLVGDDHHAVAVIGDGALTGGLAFEGLNNAGISGTNIVVILNVNDRSISKNIGGIATYLSELRTQYTYKRLKDNTKKVLGAIPIIGNGIQKVISVSKESFKESILHSTMFEDFGFEFIGPVDGHNLEKLENALRSAKELKCPVLVQVNTVKGKGYTPAEKLPGEYHGVSGFNPDTGEKPKATETFADIFGKKLAEFALKDDRIVAITAAMKYGTGLNNFNGELKNRLYDVGIAEEHAISFASGLALMGKIPVFSVYSSFLQRAYDELMHDVSIGGLHVVIGVCNAGIVGEDGETHQGLFDISFMSTIPGVTIYSPSNYRELEGCLKKALYDDPGIVCIRLPKGGECSNSSEKEDFELTDRGSDTVIVAYGRVFSNAAEAAKRLSCDVLELIKVFPIPSGAIEKLRRYKHVFVFEECYKIGSVGERLKLEIPGAVTKAIDSFVPHMSMCEAMELYGLTADKIAEIVEENR